MGARRQLAFSDFLFSEELPPEAGQEPRFRKMQPQSQLLDTSASAGTIYLYNTQQAFDYFERSFRNSSKNRLALDIEAVKAVDPSIDSVESSQITTVLFVRHKIVQDAAKMVWQNSDIIRRKCP